MYEIEFSSKARIFFNKLDFKIKKRVTKKIDSLIKNPKLGKPLKANLSGIWSLRVGKIRILYRLFQNKLIILILDIGYRKNIYF